MNEKSQMIILDEKKYVEKCLKNGLMDLKPYYVLCLLAKYYYHHLGYRKKKITSLLLDYLSKYYPRYEFNEFSWKESIDKIARNVGKHKLYEISGVKITKAEMETIQNIHNKVLERLAFTMLCLAKLNNIRNPKNNGWVNTGSKEIFKLARISCKVVEKEIKIGKLRKMGLLEFPKRFGNLNRRVAFINDDDDEELFISDFRELGYEYLLYKGGNFIRCAECGILTRGNKGGNKKYCKDCATYTPKGTKMITCVDCGKEFEVIGNNKRTTRCKDCYSIHRKQQIKQNVQKLRAKNKM